MNPASFLFSSFFQGIQFNPNPNASSTVLMLFQKFLSYRIIPLLVEITSKTTLSGKDMILQQEFYDSIMRNLLHVCDIVSNKYPHLQTPFFQNSVYMKWFSKAIVCVYLCHENSRDDAHFAILLTKSCLLGYTRSLTEVYYHYCLLYDNKVKPTSSDEKLFRLQTKQHNLQCLCQFSQSIPSLRRFDFISHFLQLFTSLPPVFLFLFNNL